MTALAHRDIDGTRFCGACGEVFDTTTALDAHQDTTGHEKPAMGAPQVWILSSGEMGEGGTIRGVYATRDAAKGSFMEAAQAIPFDLDKAWQDDDGSVHVEGGCDWVSLEPHDVISRPQIAA